MSESVQKQIAALQKKVMALEKKVVGLESNTTPVKEKVKRAPSAYNMFMSSENGKVRSENPTWDQPSVMKEIAKRWNAQKNE